jgi:hypothetical protein
MGVELELGCARCRAWVWLGSAKPAKWRGFQMGNEFVVEFLAAHAHPCRLMSRRDDADLAPWDEHPEDWAEDLRSRGAWGRVVAGEGPQPCAGCGTPLGHAPTGIAVNRFVRFCGEACLARRLAGGTEGQWTYARVSAEGRLERSEAVSLACTPCAELERFLLLDRSLSASAGEAMAQWLLEHTGPDHALSVHFDW